MSHTNRTNAIVVGASLSGLMTGIALAREGLTVTILEKVGDEQRTGSGLQVSSGMFETSKTARLLRKLASGGKKSVQLWSAIEYRLRREALSDPNITIQYNTRVDALGQDADSAWVETHDGNTLYSDILIGADGHRSLVREHVAPHHPDASYAGYIVWIIDTVSEDDLPLDQQPVKQRTGVQMFNGPNGFLFGNILESEGELGDKGKRRVGCAWYDNSRSDILYELGCVQGDVVHHSLKGPDIPDETIAELKHLTRDIWPEPWKSATLYALETRKLTGIPIKEYAPDKLANGRIAIIGDAAHVPAPITASGFNESVDDAVDLGKCVAKGVEGGDAIEALDTYESMRLNKVRQMVLSGKSFSRSFGRK